MGWRCLLLWALELLSVFHFHFSHHHTFHKAYDDVIPTFQFGQANILLICVADRSGGLNY